MSVNTALALLTRAIGKRRLARWLRGSRVLRLGLALSQRFFAPRHRVGAIAVIHDGAGKILLAEHVFRVGRPWALPGGWVERGEQPAAALQREIEEELAVHVTVERLLLCASHGGGGVHQYPPTLTLSYLCRLDGARAPRPSHEILATEWQDPLRPTRQLAIHDREAIAAAMVELSCS